ncbi:MAG: hypothetical protein JWO71_3392 [Candidatus Acidoferrum typicum]|nr:hypothetical protein [Candidatus Acidoferrum typicum]
MYSPYLVNKLHYTGKRPRTSLAARLSGADRLLMMRDVKLLVVAISLLFAGTCRAQLPMSRWISVKDFGAKGDAKTDDSLAITKAIQQTDTFGGVVYFPAASGYVFNGQLPILANSRRVTLFLDAPLVLTRTLNVLSGYVIRGNSGGQLEAFSTDNLSLIEVGPGASPAISIHHQTGVQMENLKIAYVNYGSDGIVVDGSSAEIAFKNVFVHMHGDAPSGVPLLIKGGFGYTVDGGGYASPGSSSSPSIAFTDDAACNYVGIFRVRHAFLGGHGIELSSTCGGMNSMTFEDMLFEAAVGPFLTINSHSRIGVWSISIKDINMADSVGDPKPPLIDAHCQCAGIWGVQVTNSYTDGPQLTTGDPILDLEVWSPFPGSGYKIAQSSGYVLHTPSAIYNAMPTFQVNGTSGFSINPSSQPARTIQSGQTAVYPLTVMASSGFKQTVEFSCSGQPSESTCTVAPSSTALNGPNSAPFIVAVATTARANGTGLQLALAAYDLPTIDCSPSCLYALRSYR